MKSEKEEIIRNIVRKGKYDEETKTYSPIETQDDFIDEYVRHGYNRPIQGTVSKWFKELKIESTLDSETNKLYYTTIDEKVDNDLKNVIEDYCTAVYLTSNYHTVIIRCEDKHGRRSLCKCISERFKRKFHTIIPAYDSVIVLCAKKANANRISKFVKDTLSNRN